MILQRHIACAALTLLTCLRPLSADTGEKAIEVGWTREQVIAVLGEPNSQIGFGDTLKLIYDTGKVKLVEGKVETWTAGLSGNATSSEGRTDGHRSTPEQPAPTPARVTEGQQPSSPPAAPLDGIAHSISIEGVIGSDFTSREFLSRLSIADRFAKKADIIILYIDSPGGSVSDLEEIVAAILAARGKRFVTVVEGKALSSAAVVALACDTIYMHDGARIGAATPYVQQSDGTVVHLPPAVQEKQFSAMRALVRIAAKHGGHSTDLAEAMVDPNIPLTMTRANGVPFFERDGKGAVISRKGEVLTLTADEAIDCGLAREVREFWTEYLASLVAQKLVCLASVAADPLDNFASELKTHYHRKRFTEEGSERLSEEEALSSARSWAVRECRNATWWRRPFPVVVTSVLATPGRKYTCTIVGKSLLGSADTVFASIRGEAPLFVPYLQKGDIVMVAGKPMFDYLAANRWTGSVRFNLIDCRVSQDR